MLILSASMEAGRPRKRYRGLHSFNASNSRKAHKVTRPSVRSLLSITIIVDKTQEYLLIHSKSQHQLVGKTPGPDVQYKEEFTLQSYLKVDKHTHIPSFTAEHNIKYPLGLHIPHRSSYILVQSLRSFTADHSIKLLISPQGLQQEAEFHYNHH